MNARTTPIASIRFIPVVICALAVLLAVAAQSRPTQATAPGAAISQLTNNPAIDVRPMWSPDNRSIAFQSNRDSNTFRIYLMDADGGNQRALTKGASDDRHPAWMPDGKSILFDALTGNGREIWMINVADGSLKQITRLGGLSNFPAPSPDGQRITFYFYKDELLNLWTARIDGSDAKPLTRELASTGNNQCTFACHRAAWSQDNQYIAYSGGDHHSIWMMRYDGTNAQEVVGNEDDNHFPWFLTDGRLGYITEHVSSFKSFTSAWAYDLTSGKPTLLYEGMSPQGPFEWSKDHQKVLFHSPRAGNFDIYLVDLSAPEGLPALQGTPVAVSRPESAPAPGTSAITPPTPAPAPAQSERATPTAGAGTDLIWVPLLIAAVAVGFALFVWLRRGRHEW